MIIIACIVFALWPPLLLLLKIVLGNVVADAERLTLYQASDEKVNDQGGIKKIGSGIGNDLESKAGDQVKGTVGQSYKEMTNK